MSEHPDLSSFFRDPQSYPWQMGNIQVIQTHISFVYIGDDYVFKIKKPVKFPFLDFSELKLRKAALEEELRINQRLTDGMYCSVVPVYRTNSGDYSFKKSGRIVDYGLKMRRFPDGCQLSEQLKRGNIRKKPMASIVEKLGSFYEQQALQPLKKFNPEKLISDNLEQAAHAIRGRQELRQLHWINQAQKAHFPYLKPLIHQRIGEGKVVDGHGDLHAEHVLLPADGTVSVFDAIEFKKAFREADWAYDISFLVMDLHARGYPGLALKFLTAMQKRLRDEDMMRLMPSFCAHRATIRAKANALKAEEREVPARERIQARKMSRHYLGRALCFSHLGLSPKWLVMMGPIAGGKSTLASHLAGLLGLTHLNSDVVRKEMFGLDPRTDGNPLAKDLYSPETTEKTYAGLFQRASELSRLGFSVVLDGTFHTRDKRLALRRAARKAGVQVLMFECTAPEEVLRRRLLKRQTGAHVSDARLDLLDSFLAAYEVPDSAENVVTLPPLSKSALLDSVFLALRQSLVSQY